MTQPADHAQRELAVDTNRSVIVQAPAGSGKTTLLVTRYLRLLARARKPEEILAITFTIKSAGEMRARILRALRSGDSQAVGALARNEEMGWNLLEQPARLKIQTIDSFAMSLIRQLPLASGLYPYTRLLEAPEDLYVSATRRVLYKLYEDDPLGPYVAEFLAFVDNDYARAQRLLINMLSRRDQWLDAVRELVSAHQRSPDALQAVLSQGVERLVDRAVSELTSLLDDAQIETMEAVVRGVAAAMGQNVEQAAGEFRGILRPEQTPKFDEEFAMAREGLELARSAIQDMRQGIFDPPEWQRRAREAGLGPGGPDAWRRRRAEDEGPRLTSWERYVASFVRRYRLDEGQETTALAILQDLQARRSEHEHRTAAQLDRLEQRLAQTDDAEARAALQEQRTALNQPIEQMADDLHRRLRALLTSSQRQADRERQRPTRTDETPDSADENPPVDRDR